MRVTNTMINKTSMRNMNNNKVSVDYLNTQMTTQKKISRPSEDPVIAIRALRLRSDLSEVNHFYEKNIPDAESWLELTETALTNMNTLLEDIYKQCVQGSTDSLKEDDRAAILQNLQALRTQIYKEGNADNAGRTIFTGYKTNSQLTFAIDEPDTSYDITEKMSFEDIGEKRYYANTVTLPVDESEVLDAPVLEDGEYPEEVTNFRMRLSYDGIDADAEFKLSYKGKDGTTGDITVTKMSYEDWAATGFEVKDGETIFIPESGEIIFAKDVSENMRAAKAEFTVSYSKTGFGEGEIRPEHYFDCTNTTDPSNKIKYTKENQEIAYTIAFNQTLVVNTQASNVFNASIGRDVDELMETVQAATAAHEKVDKIKEMMEQEQYSSPDMQEALSKWLEAAEKEAAYADTNMQKHYEKAVGDFQDYMSQVTRARTDVGSKGDRLKLTKERVSNQQTAFEKLKSTNEDRELSDIIIDFTSAYTAYQASLMASSRANQQTLLNYL